MSDILHKIESGRQYRNMIIEVRKDENGDNEQNWIVRGYATTFDEPYLLYEGEGYQFYEKVDRHAFDNTDLSDVIMQYDHEGRVFARKSNDTLKLTDDDHGLLIEADLGGTEIGRQLYEEIRGGYTTKMSFGFTVDGDTMEERRDDHNQVIYTRTITSIKKLYDVSAVSLPANDGTEISARAFVDGVIAKAEAERLRIAEETRKREILSLMVKLAKEI